MHGCILSCSKLGLLHLDNFDIATIQADFLDCVLQCCAFFTNLLFLGQAFTIMLVYVWARRNPYLRMNFFGLLNFQVNSIYYKIYPRELLKKY